MAAIGIERDACTGRGFDANGFAGRFLAWASKTAVNHGPGWHVIDDQSGAGLDPYVVISTHAGAYANANLARYIRLLVPTGTPGTVQVRYYLSWHTSTHSGVEWCRWSLNTVDSGGFAYDFRGGPEFLSIISRIGANADWCAWDTLDRDPLLMEENTRTGTLISPAYVEAGDSGNQLSGYHNLTGVTTLLDANKKLYFNLVNTSGSTYRIDVYNNVGRTNLVGQSSTYTNTAVGSITITGVGDGAGILGGTLTRDATSTVVSTIECRFYRLSLGTGEGANFTPGEYYYLWDFSTTSARMRYVRVLAVVGDEIDVDNVGPWLFPAGSMIRPYPHMWCAAGDCFEGGVSGSSLRFVLPYGSVQGSELPASLGSTGPRADANWDGRVLRLNPDDRGNYTLSEISITELYVSNAGIASGNRSYGYLKNIFMGSITGVAVLQDNRTMGGVDYQYTFENGSYGVYMINEESLS